MLHTPLHHELAPSGNARSGQHSTPLHIYAKHSSRYFMHSSPFIQRYSPWKDHLLMQKHGSVSRSTLQVHSNMLPRQYDRFLLMQAYGYTVLAECAAGSDQVAGQATDTKTSMAVPVAFGSRACRISVFMRPLSLQPHSTHASSS